MGLDTWWVFSPRSWYLRRYSCSFPGVYSCMAASRGDQFCAKCGSQKKFDLCPFFLVPLFPFVSTEQKFVIRLPINVLFCFVFGPPPPKKRAAAPIRPEGHHGGGPLFSTTYRAVIYYSNLSHPISLHSSPSNKYYHRLVTIPPGCAVITDIFQKASSCLTNKGHEKDTTLQRTK